MAVSLQYTVSGGKVSDANSIHDMRVIGSEVILDVDSTETPFTADYTITAQDQEIAFIVSSPATAGTLTVELYHGTTHATKLDTAALIKGGTPNSYAAPTAPAASVVLDMTVAADRNAILGVNPGAYVAATGVRVGDNNVVSLKLTASAGYTNDTTVVVTVLGMHRRHQAQSRA